jgi:hypothetical protein
VNWPGFWQWFAANAGRLRAVCSADAQSEEIEEAFKRVHDRMGEVDPDLVFEIGLKDSRFQFIVSADGNREKMNAVLECVSAAPPIEGWEIVAFRQAKPDFSLTAFGVPIGLDDIRILFEADEDNIDRLAVYFIFRTDEPLSENDMISISCLVLDHTLGEFDAMTEISSLGVHRLDADEDWFAGSGPVSDLVTEIAERSAARTRH